MKKYLSLLAFGLLVSVLGTKNVSAAGLPLPGKAAFALNYTTTASTITSTAGCLYQVVLSTGAASEYIALFDSASVTGLTAPSTTGLKTRMVFGSTSANTVYRFDPPIMFFNGIIAIDSAATGQSAFSYDYGACGTN